MNLSKISISDFNYELPEERIAKYPLDQRELSKLLYYCNSNIAEYTFKQIPSLITAGNLLVFNNTKVIQARILFKRPTGASIEIFLLEPSNPSDYAISFAAEESCRWICLVGNLKRWKEKELTIEVPETPFSLTAKKLQTQGESVEVEFTWNGSLSFARIVELCGRIPIPPYLNRNDEQVDKIRYQTVYAKSEGSVAAPTAGLHFTPELINNIIKNGVETDYITLHVGAGTFKPVKNEFVNEHEMHSEYFYASRGLIEKILNKRGNICSVGTTTIRTLESLYWIGVKIKLGQINNTMPQIGQWEPYSLPNRLSLRESMNSILTWMSHNKLEIIEANTQICIVPGYKFKVVDSLITNFHQPQSTLLLLISAFIGTKWKDVYQYALENNFRFLSYGDSSLLVRETSSNCFEEEE